MKFSIAIPAYKTRFLRESIQSVINQSFEDWELIVVDDCSPEPVGLIVSDYLKDARVHYYRNKENCGAVNVVNNWNRCLDYATGDYFICMGDDDELLPNCLELYSELIERYPGLSVYHTRAQIIDATGGLIGEQEMRPEWESGADMVWQRWLCRHRQYVGDFCYRTSDLRHEGGFFFLPLAWGSDDVTAARAAKERGIANTQDFGFCYRQNAETISNNARYAKTKIIALNAAYKWFTQYIQGLSLSLDKCQQLEHARWSFFRMALIHECLLYVQGNPIRLLWCYRTLKSMNYPKRDWLRWYVKSVLLFGKKIFF